MNINGLTTLLQELAYQGSSKVSPAGKAEGIARVRDATAAGKKPLEPVDAGWPAGQTARAEIKQTSEQPAHLAFAPLPLRSDLFKEASFFARLGGKKAGTVVPEGSAAEIFICLFTENLGRIWVGLSSRNDDFLSVKYFTENEPVSKLLKENFPSLRESLEETGFAEISLTSRARAELGAVVEGLLPRFEEHLLDRKI